MIRPDRAQRVTDSEAGPNALAHGPADHRIQGEAGGNKGEEQQVHGGPAHCRRRRETPSLFAISDTARIGRKRLARRTAMSSGRGQEQRPTLRHALAGQRRRHAGAGQAFRARAGQKPPARATSDAEVADFVRRMKQLGPAHRHRQRPAAVRHGRHHEPPADLGHGAGPAGRHVPGRQGRRRARRAARLFPRRRRMPRLQVGVRSRRAGRADDARHLRRRLHADRQGAEPRPQGGAPPSPSTRWSMSATAWRRTSTTCAAAPASWRCWACRCSCSRKARDARAERAFREIARLTRGAYCAFDAGSAAQLRDLLSAVAVYAAGGRKALKR